jgi:hypothetical protein
MTIAVEESQVKYRLIGPSTEECELLSVLEMNKFLCNCKLRGVTFPGWVKANLIHTILYCSDQEYLKIINLAQSFASRFF